ncbi:hypothetical protein BKA62DRAFT_710025 [Auriculariales sp. MPI-PUGE-AT-0066]|nr:hypothetical protein BKA62DRAFT_710025 [Auriculariales sp. MPI-PUGE-AT-0066]
MFMPDRRPTPAQPTPDIKYAGTAVPTSTALPFQRDAELWEEDGNVILVATLPSVSGSTGPSSVACPKTGFLVQQTVLSVQSQLWERLFSNRRNENENMEHGAVPVYELSDSAENLRDLLHHLNRQPNLSNDTPYLGGWTKLCTLLASILRLATKYEMRALRQEVITVLERDWPRTLPSWDDNEREIQHRIALYWQSGRTVSTLAATELDQLGPEPATIVSLALECNVASILPAAFYHLNRVYQVPKAHKLLSIPGPQNRTFIPHLLPEHVLHALLLGRESLARFASEARFNTDDLSTSFTASGDTTCCAGVRTWWQDVGVRRVSEGPWRLDPLQGIERMVREIEDENSPRDICVNCRVKLRGSLVNLRTELWNRLPRWFRVDAPSITL